MYFSPFSHAFVAALRPMIPLRSSFSFLASCTRSPPPDKSDLALSFNSCCDSKQKKSLLRWRLGQQGSSVYLVRRELHGIPRTLILASLLGMDFQFTEYILPTPALRTLSLLPIALSHQLQTVQLMKRCETRVVSSSCSNTEQCRKP